LFVFSVNNVSNMYIKVRYSLIVVHSTFIIITINPLLVSFLIEYNTDFNVVHE
jgi:hypothetical protein